MSPLVFYGSPLGVQVKQPQSFWRLLHVIRIDLKKQTEFKPRCGIYSTLHCLLCLILHDACCGLNLCLPLAIQGCCLGYIS